MSQEPQHNRRKATRHRSNQPRSKQQLLSSELQAQKRKQPQPGLGKKFAYAFDTMIARRPWLILVWLGLASLIVVIVGAAIVAATSIPGLNGEKEATSFPEALWQELLRILDTGTFAADTGWPARILGLLVTLTGIFLAGGLIGLIANILDQKIMELRKGHSRVLEQDHTVIFGWSPRVPTIVNELVIANQSRRKAAIVIVAEEDKTLMEDTLKQIVSTTGNTKLVCRTAKPWTDQALDMANVQSARSVIVTAGSNDSATVKTLLALKATQLEQELPIVAEVLDEAMGRSLRAIFGHNLATVCSVEVVAELTAQACRERGIGAVFHDLLDFAGSEIYLTSASAFTGKLYQDVALGYRHASAVGLSTREGLLLNPPHDHVVQPGDEVLVVAEDDSLINIDPVVGKPLASLPCSDTKLRPSNLMIIGWSELGPRVLHEMDEFMGPGSRVEVVIDPLQDAEKIKNIPLQHATLTVSQVSGGPEALAAAVSTKDFQQAILLGCRDLGSADEADARTLLTLLGLRDQNQGTMLRTVIELLDQRHTSLAAATGADDFVVSDQLTSQMIAQLSENHQLVDIFKELFAAEGSSIQLRYPATFGATSSSTLADITLTGLGFGWTVLGYVNVVTGQTNLCPDKTQPLPDDDHIQLVIMSDGI